MVHRSGIRTASAALIALGSALAGATPAAADPPPLTPLGRVSPAPVVVPPGGASGFQASASGGIQLAWAAGGSVCSASLALCTPSNMPNCGTPEGPALNGAAACNMAAARGYPDPRGTAGLIVVQNCTDASKNWLSCQTTSHSDVPGDAALGFNITMPLFDGQHASYALTVTPEMSVQYRGSVSDTAFPSSVWGQGNVNIYVYDLNTGSVAVRQSESVFTVSALGYARTSETHSTAPMYVPLTTTIAAVPGHTYQVWIWGSVDGNAWQGADYLTGDQFMTVVLNGIGWSVKGG